MAKNKKSPEFDIETDLLLKEADEALRQEKVEAMWKEWGQTIIGVALMVIFGTMLGVGWKNWRTSVHETRTQLVLENQDAGIIGVTMAESQGLDGVHLGLANLLSAGDVAQADMSDTTPALIRDLMIKATEAGLPARWEVVAQWAKFRAEVDLAPTSDDKLKLADAMIDAADYRENPFGPLMYAEAASLYGENGHPDKAVNILKQAAAHPLTVQTPAVNDLIMKLTHLYTTDLSVSAGE